MHHYPTGIAKLPLHYGTAPRWLFQKMVKLASSIASVIVEEHSAEEFLRKISDPFWFQSFACVLGFDWHSSGTTTVTCGALKLALKHDEHGVAVAGGKGKVSRKAPEDIEAIASFFDLDAEKYKYTSRITAKVDNAALQDRHRLYHHSFFVTKSGKWAVVQQGMYPAEQTARRYHWLSENIKDLVIEPHTSILGDTKLRKVLNMTSRMSEGARKLSVDLVKENPKKLENLIKSIRKPYQKGLENFRVLNTKRLALLEMPKNINWDSVKRAYDIQPSNYEELLAIRGIGPKTVRALALISDLVYNEKPSWQDPVKYSFAVGGKDGVPYPVDRKIMDETIAVLEQGIEEAKVGSREKLEAIKRLKGFIK
ncbi:MAG: DUF763 domain-containing protein [Candidatus Thermoplasmatota archaeon]|nr:DUF763 domain-containing protein [Candidatus Thermoplasmatota archaeon]